MSSATEVERLVVRFFSDSKQYLKDLKLITSTTEKSVNRMLGNVGKLSGSFNTISKAATQSAEKVKQVLKKSNDDNLANQQAYTKAIIAQSNREYNKRLNAERAFTKAKIAQANKEFNQKQSKAKQLAKQQQTALNKELNVRRQFTQWVIADSKRKIAAREKEAAAEIKNFNKSRQLIGKIRASERRRLSRIAPRSNLQQIGDTFGRGIKRVRTDFNMPAQHLRLVKGSRRDMILINSLTGSLKIMGNVGAMASSALTRGLGAIVIVARVAATAISKVGKALQGVLRGAQSLANKGGAYLNRFANSVTRLGSKLSAIGHRMTALGRTAFFRMTLPIVGLGGFALKEFAAFETSLAKMVGQVGLSKSLVKQFGVEIQKMAGEVGQGQTELADGLFFITSSGERTAKALDILRVSAKLSAAQFGETKDIAKLVAAAVNAYGESNLNAAQAADVLALGVNKGMATAAEFSEHLGVVIPLAAELGVSFDQVAASVAAMSRTGTKTSTAVIQLRQILQQILKPSKQSLNILKQHGLDHASVQAIVEKQGIMPFLRLLRKKFAQNKADMTKVFGNVRSISGVVDLVGKNEADNLQIFEDMATKTKGAADRAFAAVKDTLTFQFQQLYAEFKVQLGKAGEILKPVAISLIKNLRKALVFWGKLHVNIKKNVMLFAAFVAAIGPVLIALGMLTTAVGIAISIIGSFIAAIMMLASVALGALATALGVVIRLIGIITTPIGIAVTAFAAFFLAVTDLSGVLVNFGKASKGSQEAFSDAFGKMGDAVQWFKDKFSTLKTDIASTIKGVKAALANGDIQSALQLVWLKIQMYWAEGSVKIKSVLMALTTAVKGAALEMKAALSKSFIDIGVEADILGEKLKSRFTLGWNADYHKQKAQTIIQEGETAKTKIDNDLRRQKEGMQFVDNLANSVNQAIAGGKVRDLEKQHNDLLTKILTALQKTQEQDKKEQGKEILDSIGKFITDKVSDFYENLKKTSLEKELATQVKNKTVNRAETAKTFTSLIQAGPAQDARSAEFFGQFSAFRRAISIEPSSGGVDPNEEKKQTARDIKTTADQSVITNQLVKTLIGVNLDQLSSAYNFVVEEVGL